MAAHIISWSSKQKNFSPTLSKTPSMISFDSLLSDNPERPLAGVEGALLATESQAKHTSSQVIEPTGSRACPSVSVCTGAGAAEVLSYDTTNTSSKMETSHFWCVIFSHETCVHAISIVYTVCRLATRCTASTDISSRVTWYTSPTDSLSSTSATMKHSLPSYS